VKGFIPRLLVLHVSIAAIAMAVATGVPAATDWPQFLGPTRNGVYAGPALAEAWGPSGPKVIWRKQVGQGFAGPAVVGNRVILFHRVGAEEVVESLDAATGNSLWRYAYPTTYRDDFGFDEGPRAVPVVNGGIIYTFGAQGQLHAIDFAKGTRVWSEDTMKRFGVPKGFFGAGGSPLVEGGRVIANIGGDKAGVVAFDAKTGKVVWTATDDDASYSSGVGATISGRRSDVFLTRDNLVGLDPATGAVQFQRRWRSRQAASVNAATPIVVGNEIFVSAEYGPGAGVLSVDGSQLVDVWTSDEVLSNHYATSVYHNGYLYGYHGRQEFGPSFRAVDFRTGMVKWSQDQFRAGSVLLAGDRLVIMREGGELILAPASPQGFKPGARAQVLQGVARPYPALADGLLYVRNENTLVCLDLRR
jgi:outer membrane protein assembly factor BamB